MTKKKKKSELRFAFFGTPQLAVTVLNELASAGLTPSLVVTMPDEKKGRGLSLTPPPVKEWAEAHGIPVLQPVVFTDEIIDTLKRRALMCSSSWPTARY